MDDKQILSEYYNKKAQEYEEVYQHRDPIRLHEQQLIAVYIKAHFKDRVVLELACGSGYWTKYVLEVAKQVIAIDQSQEMLDIAKSRYGKHRNISFIQGDAYKPPANNPPYTACMSNFLFSHIPRKKIPDFLQTVHKRLDTNSFVMFVDSNYQEGQGGTLVKKDGEEDTWKRRKLNSGEEYDILKNYFSEDELREIFGKYTKSLEIQYMKNFWIVGYNLQL